MRCAGALLPASTCGRLALGACPPSNPSRVPHPTLSTAFSLLLCRFDDASDRPCKYSSLGRSYFPSWHVMPGCCCVLFPLHHPFTVSRPRPHGGAAPAGQALNTALPAAVPRQPRWPNALFCGHGRCGAPSAFQSPSPPEPARPGPLHPTVQSANRRSAAFPPLRATNHLLLLSLGRD